MGQKADAGMELFRLIAHGAYLLYIFGKGLITRKSVFVDSGYVFLKENTT
jgi:hypothetical protein